LFEQQSAFNTFLIHALDLNQQCIINNHQNIQNNEEARYLLLQHINGIANDCELRDTALIHELYESRVEVLELIEKIDKLPEDQLRQQEEFMLSVFRAINGPDKEPVILPQSVERESTASFDYFKFENHFRGPREHVKKTLKQYMYYLSNKKHVIDLGCGRGELLELISEYNISAVGVDISREFVDWCNFNGHKAILGDAIDYLASVEENTTDAITGIQLAEHLDFDKLLELCSLAYKKLADGGVFIMETPNPSCLSIYANAFYLDPTHNKPVHPLLLKYIIENAGFSKVELVFSEHSKARNDLPFLKASAENINEFNNGVTVLSELLFGSQDYAVIAVK